MIEVDNVSMRFRMTNDRINSLKEYFVSLMERRLKYEEFQVLDSISFRVKKRRSCRDYREEWSRKEYLVKNHCRSIKAY